MKTHQPARFVRPVQELTTLVNVLEKLHSMPRDEVLMNTKMVEEIRNSVNAENISALVNSIANEYNELRNETRVPAASENALLYAYAQREHKRIQKAQGKSYVTEIVNGKDLDDLKKNIIPEKASRAAERDFSSVFNSVYSNGAVKINTPNDPSTLMSYIDYSPYRVNYTEYLSVPTLSEMIDRPIAMALKKPFIVKTENEPFKEALKKVFKKVSVYYCFKRM